VLSTTYPLRDAWRVARLWLGFVLVYVAYRELADLLPRFIPAGVEDRLRALDERLLGVSPSWWLARFASPWLTDLFAFAYGLMFVLPLVLLLMLQARRRWEEMRSLAHALMLAFVLGFIGYVLVPARSPRLAYPYATALHGHGLYEVSEWMWDHLQVMTYDAFPSLHTGVSTISLVWARRAAPRWLFWVYVPAVVLLQIATLYLRQHYFVDVAAGWALAAVVVMLCG
jgi:membrane-associated phospholipid phosphatase